MYQILILLDDAALTNAIKVVLDSSIQVLPAYQSNPFDQTFDLCLIDELQLARWHTEAHTRRQAEYPVQLPFLLLMSRKAIQNRQWQHWQPIDDFLILPLDTAELQARLSLLLRSRRSSLIINAGQRQTQAFLQRNEQQFSLLAQNMPVMLSAWGKNNTFVFWNRECERVTGYTPEEMVNNPDALGLLYPDAAYRDAIMAEWKSRPSLYQNWELNLTTKTGQVRTIAWSSLADQFPMFDWATWDIGVDVTERNRARAMADALRDTTNALTSTLQLTDVFDRILANLVRVVPHEAANIMLIEGEEVYVVRSYGYEALHLEQVVATWRQKLADTNYLSHMQQTRQPIVVPDVNQAPMHPSTISFAPVQSYVGAPICLQDTVIGFINLHSLTRDFFTPVEADQLQAFTESAAIAIQNARMHEQAQLVAADQERQRLARDLHDAVSQSLFAACIITEALPQQFDKRPEVVKDRLHTLHRLMRGALAETRTLLLELRPNDLARMEIAPLLAQLAEGVQSRKNIIVETELENLLELELNVKKAFYRIAQEALNNVLKHAHATRAHVTLLQQGSQVQLTITDNGRGFDLTQVAPTSLGLEIMRERAQAIGARLTIHSQPDHGTEIKMSWPQDAER